MERSGGAEGCMLQREQSGSRATREKTRWNSSREGEFGERNSAAKVRGPRLAGRFRSGTGGLFLERRLQGTGWSELTGSSKLDVRLPRAKLEAMFPFPFPFNTSPVAFTASGEDRESRKAVRNALWL